MVVPAETPVTMPEPEPMVAIVVALLFHVPPPVASDNEVVKPTHTVFVPVITEGKAITVT
jgi:hypothetical protein